MVRNMIHLCDKYVICSTTMSLRPITSYTVRNLNLVSLLFYMMQFYVWERRPSDVTINSILKNITFWFDNVTKILNNTRVNAIRE